MGFTEIYQQTNKSVKRDETLNNSVRISIQQFSDQQTTMVSDSIAVEEPLEIWIKTYSSANQSDTQRLVTTMRTPMDDEALARGWILTTGLVVDSDIQSIDATGTERLKGQGSNQVLITLRPGVTINSRLLQRAEFVNSSCGVCGQQSIEFLLDSLPENQASQRVSLPVSQLYSLTEQLNQQQSLFSLTGGNHGAGLFDETALLLDVKEDVGRHNALDKLIGANIDRFPGKYGVVLSGRVSFELVQKAAMAGISMILAIGAPTSLAVELCKECDICLVGFVKENSFNIYNENRQLAQY